MSLQPLELGRAYPPAADQPLPLVVCLPVIAGLSVTLWLALARVAKALLGL